MSENVILVDTDWRGVVTVTLNRPQVNNAYNAEVVGALIGAFGEIEKNEQARVVLIRGNGKHFQAGADLNWLREIGAMDDSENEKTSQRTATLVQALNEFALPTIALIHGACIGGGTGIACACDIVIASEDAQFAISEARWGNVASIIFPQLIAAIGERNVRRFAISGEKFGANKAQQIGLVHEVCATGQLDSIVEPIIDSILLNGPDAVNQTKRTVLETAGSLLESHEFQKLVTIHAKKRQTSEASEGFSSFVEKRHPSWYPVSKSVE